MIFQSKIERHLSLNLIKNGPFPASFYLFSSFQTNFFTEKTVGFSGIRTRIVGVEGENAEEDSSASRLIHSRECYKTFFHRS